MASKISSTGGMSSRGIWTFDRLVARVTCVVLAAEAREAGTSTILTGAEGEQGWPSKKRRSSTPPATSPWSFELRYDGSEHHVPF